jgi:hypothetical protein
MSAPRQERTSGAVIAAIIGLITIAAAALGALAAELVRAAPPPLGAMPSAVSDDIRRLTKESFELGRRVEARRAEGGSSR